MEEPDFPYPTKKGNRKAKWSVLIGVFLIAIIAGVLFIKQRPKITEIKKVVAVEYKQLSNSPTTKPIKEKKNVTIQVLNGTGIPGQAAKVVQALEAAGYNSDNIKSGNAETTEHVGTTITSYADFEEIIINIRDILKPIFPEITNGIPNTNPNEDSGFDVIVITGNKLPNNIALIPTTAKKSPTDSSRPILNPTKKPISLEK